MSKLACYILAIALSQLCGCRKPLVSLGPGSEAVNFDIDPCITIEYSTYGRRDPGVGLVLAAWRDGRVVYSEDLRDGGPPFQCGVVLPEKIEALTSVFEAAPWSISPDDNNAYPVYAIARLDFSESHCRRIYRHRFDDLLLADPVVSIEELSGMIDSKELNRDSAWVDSSGKELSSGEMIGRALSILIPEKSVPFVTTLRLRNY